MIDRSCPPGHHWNNRENCCDDPARANCIFGQAPLRPSIPEEEFTTTVPTTSTENSSTETVSPPTTETVSPPTSETISPPTTLSTTTDATEISPTTTDTTEISPTTSDATEMSPTTLELPSSTTGPPSNFLCPNLDPFRNVYPHPDCQRFYEDRHDIVIDRYCPEGYHWNNRDNCCDDPDRANCIFGQAPFRPSIPQEELTTSSPATHSPSTESSSTESTSTETTSTMPHPTIERPTTIENRPPSNFFCPNRNPFKNFYPHPDCRRFYDEQYNRIIDRACPDGYHWNNMENCCDNPVSANCVFGQAPLRPDAIIEDASTSR